MSIEDLRDQGVLLPEDEWGEHRVQTTISQGPLVFVFVLAIASLVAAYLGDGQTLTWVGVGVFFLAFFGMVSICNQAIRQQRRRFERERDQANVDAAS